MQDYIWNDLMAQGNNLDCMDINVDSIYTMDLSLSRFTFGLELVFFFWFPNLYMYTDTKKNISTSCKRQARGITTYITSSYCVLFGTYYKWCELLLVLACSCLMSLSLPSVSPHCIHKQSHRDHYLFSSLPLIPSYWNNRFDCYHFNYI